KTPRAGLPFSSRRHPELKLSCWTGRPQRRVHLHNRWSLPPAPNPELTPPRYTSPLQLRNTICQTSLSLSLSHHTHVGIFTWKETHKHTHTHTHTLSLSICCLSPPITLSISLSLALSLSA